MKIIVAGGGWAGCAAACEARKRGAEVILLERTDLLLGTGLVGGIMRNNGRYTAAEEMIAMGGGDMFRLTDSMSRHENISFPGHQHASIYDVSKMPQVVLKHLKDIGVESLFQARITKAKMSGNRLDAVMTGSGIWHEADVFIDATGTAGPVSNCTKYGNGCAMCILRCPSFGGRVSLTNLAGGEEIQGKKEDGSIGAMSGACKLYKDSLSKEIRTELAQKGAAVIPLPLELQEHHLEMKACQQYARKEYSENIILIDTGHAKLMMPFYDMQKLKQVPGFEFARYEDPYAGSKGNSMRYFAMARRDDTMKVKDVENLFCAGEKAGLLVGHTEAIVTGVLAGYNSVETAKKKPLLTLSRNTAVGEAIAWVRECMETEKGLKQKYTFSGSVLWDHMRRKGLYETDTVKIRQRIETEKLSEVFSRV